MGDHVNIPKNMLHDVFQIYDTDFTGELGPSHLQCMYSELRVGGISTPQIEESIKYVCAGDGCDESELNDLLQEMDRRYFLVQDLKWEFSMLDRNQTNTITEAQAKWFVQCVHGEFFSHRRWENFLRQRSVPASGVTFPEIEVILCNIPSISDIMEDEEEELKMKEAQMKRELQHQKQLEKEEKQRKKLINAAALKKAKKTKGEEKDMALKLQQEQRDREKIEEEARRKMEEELEEEKQRRAKEEEERLQREIQEERKRQELEAQRLKEEEERQQKEENEAKNYEALLKESVEKEHEFTSEADQLKKLGSEDPKNVEAEKRARLKAKEWKNKRIRYALKVAIAKRDVEKIRPAVKAFKDSKLPDDDMDLEKAERILKEYLAKDGLLRAMANPTKEALDKHIDNLEQAIHFIKRNGFENSFHKELVQANNLLKQLRKRFKIYGELLALDQPTVAEIKSYSNPPEVVHTVMMAVFIMLGHKEKDMKDWQNVRIWVGKTGKEGLKRRCLEYLKEPSKVNPKDAKVTKAMLDKLDLDDVRDVSAGAATFFIWAWTMVEESDVQQEQMQREKEEQARKQLEKKKRVEQGEQQEDEETEIEQKPLESKKDTKRKGKETKEQFSLTEQGKVKKTK